jgi:hypothetical protein
VRGVAVICGIVEHKRGPSLKHGGFSWPLGRLKLDDIEPDAIYPLLFGLGRTRIRYEEIAEAEVTHGLRPVRPRTGGTIRLRMADGNRGDVVITTLGSGYEAIAGVLSEHGVRMHE